MPQLTPTLSTSKETPEKSIQFTVSVYFINSSPHLKTSGNLNIWLLRLDNVAAICIVLVDEVNGELVGGHHDGCVGDLPDEVGGEAPIKSRPALLLVNQAHSLPERSILQPWLP